MTMHPLLITELQKHLGQAFVPTGPWQAAAQALSLHYGESDRTRAVLQGLLDAMEDRVCVKSAEGVYLACNRAYALHMGQAGPADLMGKTDPDIVPEGMAQAVLAADAQAQHAAAGEHHFSERWELDGDNSKVCFETLRAPFFDAEGQLSGLVCIGRDVTERKNTEQTLQRQSRVDVLTQLPNRRSFMERLDHEVKLANRSRLSLSVLSIGLDRFKDVNEMLGHDVGDALLVQVARRIQDVVRETDVAARMDGDEFAVIIHNLHDVTDVERIAQNLIRRLAEPFVLLDEKAQISASVGIAVFPANSRDAQELVKHAGQAMYFAKSSGRNRFSHFTFGLQEAAAQRNRLARDLRRAVDVNQFEVYYQPVVELGTGLVRHAEALVRWNHDGRGQIMPLEFIPLAEDNGAIIDIGDWVFREAAQQVKHLREKFHPDFSISINASPVQFRSNRTTPADWMAVLSELGLPGSAMVLELTEGVLLKAEEFSSHKLKAFREAGFQFAIDDFGTGYSSLSYLQRFDVDYLKIDQSFVSDLESDPSALVLCEAIIVMAHKLGLKVIAEGVETEAQQALLMNAGCDFAQGFLFARPVCAAELEQKLASLR